jgi:hypothetical protein
MSIPNDIELAVKQELSKAEFRHLIEGVEHVVLEAAKNAVESLLPPLVRKLAGPLMDTLAEKGITAVEHLTDEALLNLGVVHIVTATGTLQLTYVATPNSDTVKTVADLPAAAK